MASTSKKVRDFQIDFLEFLNDKNVPETHIYHHIMNYWSNDQSVISLQELKDAITDLCDRKYIVSKNNAHNSIGLHSVSEEDQKNNAICIIQEPGQRYIKRVRFAKAAKKIFIALLIIAVLYSMWYYKIVSYFFR
jgi:hypothetical protein